jgi:hypothetical protein
MDRPLKTMQPVTLWAHMHPGNVNERVVERALILAPAADQYICKANFDLAYHQEAWDICERVIPPGVGIIPGLHLGHEHKLDNPWHQRVIERIIEEAVKRWPMAPYFVIDAESSLAEWARYDRYLLNLEAVDEWLHGMSEKTGKILAWWPPICGSDTWQDRMSQWVKMLMSHSFCDLIEMDSFTWDNGQIPYDWEKPPHFRSNRTVGMMRYTYESYQTGWRPASVGAALEVDRLKTGCESHLLGWSTSSLEYCTGLARAINEWRLRAQQSFYKKVIGQALVMLDEVSDGLDRYATPGDAR